MNAIVADRVDKVNTSDLHNRTLVCVYSNEINIHTYGEFTRWNMNEKPTTREPVMFYCPCRYAWIILYLKDENIVKIEYIDDPEDSTEDLEPKIYEYMNKSELNTLGYFLMRGLPTDIIPM